MEPSSQATEIVETVVGGKPQNGGETNCFGSEVVRVQYAIDPIIQGELAIAEGSGERPHSRPRTHPHSIAELVNPKCKRVNEWLSEGNENQRQEEIDEKRVEVHAAIVDGLTKDDEAEWLVD